VVELFSFRSRAVILVITVFFLIGAGYLFYYQIIGHHDSDPLGLVRLYCRWWANETYKDLASRAGAVVSLPVKISVKPGDTLSDVAERVYEAKLISDPESLRCYWIYNRSLTAIEPGDYYLARNMTGLEIADVFYYGLPDEDNASPDQD
jgi:hypothetical protein